MKMVGDFVCEDNIFTCTPLEGPYLEHALKDEDVQKILEKLK